MRLTNLQMSEENKTAKKSAVEKAKRCLLMALFS